MKNQIAKPKSPKKHIKRHTIKENPIVVIVLKEDEGYSAQTKINNKFIGTDGEDFDELKKNILEAINFAFELEGKEYTIENLVFDFDIESFFHFYRVINAKALSERIGMNQSLLAQYINGKKKPSTKQTHRILDAIQKIGRELSEVKLINSF